MLSPVVKSSELGIILIDAQPFFWKHIFSGDKEGHESTMIRIEHLLMLADWIDIPVLATFEHPVNTNGELPDRLGRVFPVKGMKYTKRTYNCCLEPKIHKAIGDLKGKQLAIAGAETDVCVLQSVLGLLNDGYTVFLLEDCLFTSEPNPGPAIRRMYQAGAIPTSFKSLAYELCISVENTPWISSWIDKDREGIKPFPDSFQKPETFPAWDPKI